MGNTYLLEILLKFSEAELQRWSQYVETPYHISNERVRVLGQHLYRERAGWQSTALTKEAIWRVIQPDKPFRVAAFNNLLSDLLQATYDFLVLENLRKQPELRQRLEVQQLLEMRLTRQAQRRINRYEQQGIPVTEGVELLYTAFQNARVRDSLALMSSRRQHSTALAQQSQHLAHYYALQQLQLYCDMLSRQRIVQGAYDMPHLEYLLATYSDSGVDCPGSIRIYVALAQLLRSGTNDVYFAELEARIQTYAPNLPAVERRMLYNFVQNYCVQQINQGRSEYYRQVLDNYQRQLDEGLLLQEGQLSQWTYTNIITSGSRLKAWDWTEAFAEKYRTALPPSDQYNAYHYNLAALRYEQGNDNEALQGLHQVEFKDAFYHLAAKTIQLKIYYRQGSAEAFQALIFATRQFVLRNRQLSTVKKQAYQNFLRLIKRLFDLRYEAPFWTTAKRQQRTRTLQERLANQTYTANNKGWLQAELDQLV